MSTMRLRRIAGGRALGAGFAAVCVLAYAAAFSANGASAISSDYCGYGISAATSGCYEGSGYRGWRYHQASSAGVTVSQICAHSWTGSNYRTGSACYGTNVTFYSFCNASDTPLGNSSVGWLGGGGTNVIYGHTDSSTSHSTIISNNGC